MARQFSLPEQAHMVEALPPATDAAGRTGAYITLKNAHKVFIVFHVTQGNAATIAITVNQATAVAGTSAKAITGGCRIWSNLDCAASDTIVRQADAVSYTTDAGVKHKIVVLEVDPASFDIANGFDCMAVATGASNVANITQALYYIVPSRISAATPPSAVID